MAHIPRMLRMEGVAIAALLVYVYRLAGGAWSVLLWAVWLPDLAMLGYLAGPRSGAMVYNACHTYVGPVCLGLGLHTVNRPVWPALVWALHIAVDRALGFGLKYQTGFHDTHLGRLKR